MSSDLAAFLLARIADDEAVAMGPWLDRGKLIARYGSEPRLATTSNGYIDLNPAALLAECEAKRRIIAHLQPTIDDRFEASELVEWTTTTLRLLAAPYSSHPEFDPVWTVDQ